MRGGAGDDTYVVDNAGDRVVESAGGGYDRVNSSVSFTLASNVERLVLTGTGSITGKGNALDNTIYGNGGSNILVGLDGNDAISAGAGNDSLYGGDGNDRLTGGAGSDRFYFDTAPTGLANADRITDFSLTDDSIVLDQSAFNAIATTGNLSASAFRAGTDAQDADDRIIYDAATGRLYYDADGVGGGAKVLFALVTAGLELTSGDFLITG